MSFEQRWEPSAVEKSVLRRATPPIFEMGTLTEIRTGLLTGLDRHSDT